MATVNEICALTCRKYVVQRSKSFWKTKIALVKLPGFCFREYTLYYKLLLFMQIKFLDFLNFKKRFGGYFQWNVCTYFQKICGWIRYSNAKFIRDKLIFSVIFLCFCLEKKLKNAKFSDIFISKRTFDGYFLWNVCPHFQKMYIRTRHQHFKFFRETSIFFGRTTPFLL